MKITLEQLPQVLAYIQGELSDWREPLKEFGEGRLMAIQRDHALAQWGGAPLWKKGVGLSIETQRERADGEGYYANPPGRGATNTTRLYWTGETMKSTATLTAIGADFAEVDTAVAYDGPIPASEYADPAEELFLDIHGARLWDTQRIDQGLEFTVQANAAKIAAAAERRF